MVLPGIPGLEPEILGLEPEPTRKKRQKLPSIPGWRFFDDIYDDEGNLLDFVAISPTGRQYFKQEFDDLKKAIEALEPEGFAAEDILSQKEFTLPETPRLKSAVEAEQEGLAFERSFQRLYPEYWVDILTGESRALAFSALQSNLEADPLKLFYETLKRGSKEDQDIFLRTLGMSEQQRPTLPFEFPEAEPLPISGKTDDELLFAEYQRTGGKLGFLQWKQAGAPLRIGGQRTPIQGMDINSLTKLAEQDFEAFLGNVVTGGLSQEKDNFLLSLGFQQGEIDNLFGMQRGFPQRGVGKKEPTGRQLRQRQSLESRLVSFQMERPWWLEMSEDDFAEEMALIRERRREYGNSGLKPWLKENIFHELRAKGKTPQVEQLEQIVDMLILETEPVHPMNTGDVAKILAWDIAYSIPFETLGSSAFRQAVKQTGKKAAENIFQKLLSTGFDEWIATRGRLPPDTRGKLANVIIDDRNWLIERATQNMLRRQAEKKGLRETMQSAVDDTIREMETRLLGPGKAVPELGVAPAKPGKPIIPPPREVRPPAGVVPVTPEVTKSDAQHLVDSLKRLEKGETLSEQELLKIRRIDPKVERDIRQAGREVADREEVMSALEDVMSQADYDTYRSFLYGKTEEGRLVAQKMAYNKLQEAGWLFDEQSGEWLKPKVQKSYEAMIDALRSDTEDLLDQLAIPKAVSEKVTPAPGVTKPTLEYNVTLDNGQIVKTPKKGFEFKVENDYNKLQQLGDLAPRTQYDAVKNRLIQEQVKGRFATQDELAQVRNLIEAKGLTPRGLLPEDVIVTPDGKFKVVDVGNFEKSVAIPKAEPGMPEVLKYPATQAGAEARAKAEGIPISEASRLNAEEALQAKPEVPLAEAPVEEVVPPSPLLNVPPETTLPLPDNVTVSEDRVIRPPPPPKEPPPPEPSPTHPPQPAPIQAGRITMPDLQAPQTVVDMYSKPDFWRRVGNLPLVRKAVGLFNPAAVANSPAQQAIILRAVLKDEGAQKAQAVMSHLWEIGTQERVWGKTDEMGLLTKEPFGGISIDDIRQSPSKFSAQMTEHQKEWIKRASEIEKVKLEAIKRNGIEINELSFEDGGEYAGRRVMGKFNDSGELIESGRIAPGGRAGAKQPFEKTRIFKTALDGISAGYRYMNSDEALYYNTLGAYNKIADKQMADWILAKVDWRDTKVPEALVLQVEAAQLRLRRAQQLLAALNRAVRGERVASNTINSIATAYPDQADTLKNLIPELQKPSPETADVVRVLDSEAKALISEARLEYAQAVDERARAREEAMRVKYEEASIAHPAFAGKIFTGAEAKEIADILNRGLTPQFIEALGAVNKVNAIGRFFMLAGDASPMAIQLQFLAFYRPKAYAKSWGGFVRAMFDPEFQYRQYANNRDLINRHPTLILSGRGTEFTEFMGRGGLGKKLGVLAKPLVPFQKAFEGALDTAGIELAKSLDHLATTPERTLEVDQFINEFRGITSSARIGVSSTQRQVEVAMLLAPRYNRAIGGYLFDVVHGGIRGTQARLSLAQGFAGLAAMAVVVSIALGEDDDEIWEHFNPESPKFFTWNVAGVKIGLGGKVRSVIKTFGNMTRTGEIGQPALNFLRGNLSPGASTGLDLLIGKNYIGDPTRDNILDFTKTVGRNFMMIWIQNFLLEGGTLKDKALIATAEFFGLRGYDISAKKELKIKDLEDRLGEGIGKTPVLSKKKPDIYDTRNIFSATKNLLKNERPEDVLADKGYAGWGHLVVKIQQSEANTLPNIAFKDYNFDKEKGDTFPDYRLQWAERQRIEEAGERATYVRVKIVEGKEERTTFKGLEALNAHKIDYPNAQRGNLSKRDRELLLEYNAAVDKKKFIEDHPEMKVNRRTDWLKAHPKENAELALVWQAPLLTKDAHNAFKTLIKERDVVDAAIPPITLPPEGSIDNYFKYQEMENKNSWEAQLMLVRDPDLLKFLERQPIDTPIASLELKVKNRANFDKLAAFSDKDSPDYIADEKKRAEAVKKFRSDNPEFVDDTRRLEAIEKLKTVYTVDYSNSESLLAQMRGLYAIADDKKFGDIKIKMATESEISDFGYGKGFIPSAWYSNKTIYLNPNVFDPQKLQLSTSQPGGIPYLFNVLAHEIGHDMWDRLPTKEKEKFERYARQNLDDPWVSGATRTKKGELEIHETYAQVFANLPHYARVAKSMGRDISELQEFFPDIDVDAIETKWEPDFIQAHVDYGNLIDQEGIGSSSAEAMLYRVDNPEYDKWRQDATIWDKPLEPIDVTRIPIWRIDVKYRKEDAEYKAILDKFEGREETKEAKAYLAKNEAYRKDRRRREAYSLTNSKTGYKFPTTEVENYVSYNEIAIKGFRRERFLIENTKFVEGLYKAGAIVDLPNPAKVPAVQYDDIYDQFAAQFDEVEGNSKPESEWFEPDKDKREARDRVLRFTNGKYNEFGLAELRRNAYYFKNDAGRRIPEEQIDNDVAFRKIEGEGKGKDYEERYGTDLWYEDDWFLMENLDYYKEVYRDIRGIKVKRDFRKVPTREVWAKYLEYLELPDQSQRYYRWVNEDLQEWGERALDWQPLQRKPGAIPLSPDWKERQRERLKAIGSIGRGF